MWGCPQYPPHEPELRLNSVEVVLFVIGFNYFLLETAVAAVLAVVL